MQWCCEDKIDVVNCLDDGDGSKNVTQGGNPRCFSLHLCHSISFDLGNKRFSGVEFSVCEKKKKKKRKRISSSGVFTSSIKSEIWSFTSYSCRNDNEIHARALVWSTIKLLLQWCTRCCRRSGCQRSLAFLLDCIRVAWISQHHFWDILLEFLMCSDS